MLPYPSRRLNLSVVTLSFAVLSLNLLAKIVATVWLSQHEYSPHNDAREYSKHQQLVTIGIGEPANERGVPGYVGDDHPATWPIARPPVLMASDNTRRFRLNTSDGAAEWAAIIPGDGLVRLGPRQQPYTISMVHQLRCLGILRNEIVSERERNMGPTALSRHCLNYIRQMVLCRGDIYLESFHYASHEDPIDLFGIYECRDWGAVYDAIRRNQRKYRD